MTKKSLILEGTLPPPEPEDTELAIPSGDEPDGVSHISAYEESTIAHRLNAETAEDVHVIVRGNMCHVTGVVQEENVEKIRSLLTGMGINIVQKNVVKKNDNFAPGTVVMVDPGNLDSDQQYQRRELLGKTADGDYRAWNAELNKEETVTAQSIVAVVSDAPNLRTLKDPTPPPGKKSSPQRDFLGN
jgi:hypothetical protein